MTRKTAQTQFLHDTGNLIRTILKHEGFCVPRARADRQAICLIEIMLPPKLIRLDTVVPDVNGFELFGVLCRNPDWQRTPIMTAAPTTMNRIHCGRWPKAPRLRGELPPRKVYILATSISE